MKKRIVVFAGNSCAKEREPYYFPLAYNLGKNLAKNGYITVTGGGPGLMNEAMKGAYENNGETIGICLKSEKANSRFSTHTETFSNLLPRQKRLIEEGDGFVALPGGIGTYYEIFEILARKRKYEIDQGKPLILMDPVYLHFDHLMKHIHNEGFFTDTVWSLYQRVDTVENVIASLNRCYHASI